MKKSVVILIAVIYVAAIALVSFFGIRSELLEETVYVSGIEIVGDGVATSATGAKSVRVYLDENGHGEYQLDWRVTPTNATNTKVVFNYDESKTYVTVDDKGLVKFTRPGVITVTLTPADGTVLSAPVQIKIIGLKK